MRKLLRNDTSIRVISVLISILLWMYVVSINDPSVSVTLKGIPVNVTNNKAFDASGLKIIARSVEKIDVKIDGRHSEVSKVSANDIKATVDVSKITSAGTYELDVVLNSPESGMKYTNVTAGKVKYFVDYIVAVYKDVEVSTTGTPKEGYMVESVTTEETKVSVRGPKSVVDTGVKAVAILDVNGADDDISQNCSFKVVDSKGKEIDMTYVTTTVTEIPVDVKFTQTKEVKTNPVFTNSELLEDYDITVSPETIKIVGPATVIKSVTVLDSALIEIDGSVLPDSGSKTITATLKIPEGVSLAENEPSKIELNIIAKNR